MDCILLFKQEYDEDERMEHFNYMCYLYTERVNGIGDRKIYDIEYFTLLQLLEDLEIPESEYDYIFGDILSYHRTCNTSLFHKDDIKAIIQIHRRFVDLCRVRMTESEGLPFLYDPVKGKSINLEEFLAHEIEEVFVTVEQYNRSKPVIEDLSLEKGVVLEDLKKKGLMSEEVQVIQSILYDRCESDIFISDNGIQIGNGWLDFQKCTITESIDIGNKEIFFFPWSDRNGIRFDYKGTWFSREYQYGDPDIERNLFVGEVGKYLYEGWFSKFVNWSEILSCDARYNRIFSLLLHLLINLGKNGQMFDEFILSMPKMMKIGLLLSIIVFPITNKIYEYKLRRNNRTRRICLLFIKKNREFKVLMILKAPNQGFEKKFFDSAKERRGVSFRIARTVLPRRPIIDFFFYFELIGKRTIISTVDCNCCKGKKLIVRADEFKLFIVRHVTVSEELRVSISIFAEIVSKYRILNGKVFEIEFDPSRYVDYLLECVQRLTSTEKQNKRLEVQINDKFEDKYNYRKSEVIWKM